MHARTRALALRQRQLAHRGALPWIGWATLASLAVAGAITAAHAQSSITPPDAPPAAQPSTPAEIQPGHPADGRSGIVAPSTGTSGPQTVAPAPLPPGTAADTPGGSARGGVIPPPPAAGDAAINKGAPSTGPMPVIPPPGSPGGNPRVVPR